MEFGHVAESELANIDFTLPADSQFTLETLSRSESNDKFKVHVGLSKWHHKSWKGVLYTQSLEDGELPNAYANQYDTIEQC
jgi:hypothetical protein